MWISLLASLITFLFCILTLILIVSSSQYLYMRLKFNKTYFKENMVIYGSKFLYRNPDTQKSVWNVFKKLGLKKEFKKELQNLHDERETLLKEVD